MRTTSEMRLVAICLLSLVGCRSSDDAKFTIGMSQSNLDEPWRAQMNKDIEDAAAKHPEIKVIYKNAEQDSLKQQAHVREFIEKGVDVLIISPNEAAPLTAPVEEAMEAGIPVIVLDRAILSENYTCFIGADNIKIGRAAGEWLVKKLGGKGKVVELKGGMTSLPGQHRHQGFREAIEGTDIEVIFEPDTEWLEENARAEMVSALDRFPEIDAVYGHNDPAANGAYLAAKAAGREKEMLFVGIDALPKEGLQYVREGRLDATFYYPTCGAEAIDVAMKILSGQQVPKKIVLGSRVFTAENVDQGGEPLDVGARESPDEPAEEAAKAEKAETENAQSGAEQ